MIIFVFDSPIVEEGYRLYIRLVSYKCCVCTSTSRCVVDLYYGIGNMQGEHNIPLSHSKQCCLQNTLRNPESKELLT